MSDRNLKPKSYGHVSSGSVDTNVSAFAESTLSMGLSMFPKPPSSTPSTPLRSEFGGAPLSIWTTLPVHSNSPSRPSTQDAGCSNPSSPHAASRGRSFIPNSTPFYTPDSMGSFQTPSTCDFNGTSSIDVDAFEEKLLPTSFITALLQENRDQWRLKHDAMSGISEMTYPSPLDNLDTDNNTLYASGSPLDSHMPPNASLQTHKPFRPISGDSETLHSNQGHTPIIRTASVSRRLQVQGASVVGVAPATLRKFSGARGCSSSVDAGNPLDNSLHRSAYQGDLFYSEPAEPHIKDTAVDSASTSLLSRISGLSLRRWKKDKPLPPVPDFSHTLSTAENAHKNCDESASLVELIDRAGVLRDLLAKGQHPHHSMASYNVLSEAPSAPRSVQDTGGVKFETVSMAAASRLSPSHTVFSAKYQPAAVFTSASRKKKKIFFLILFVLIIALAAIGVGVGISIGVHRKQRLPVCTGNFTGAACNLGNHFPSPSLTALINILDATCVCTSSVGCNGLATAVVDLIPIVNQNFATNISLMSAYNSLWIMQGSPTTSNCAPQALLADIGNGNEEHLYPNRTQWAQTALLWNAIQTQDVNAAGQLQQFVQKISWTSLGTSDGPVSNPEQGFSTTVAGFVFNFASQTVTPPSASFITLGQPTNAQISRVDSQAQTTLNRIYAFAQGMSFLRCASIDPLKQKQTASSIQHQTALMTYWTSVLLQRPQDLAVFKAALSASPVLLPFNASSPSIRTLYSNSTSSLFPPPLACFPNLTSAVQQQINSVETSIFGLQPINTTSEFDTSCYQDRPVYGVLDILRLRLPFLDSQAGAVKQAVVLTGDVNPRVVLYNGLLFSTAPNVTSTITSSQLDVRQYGTLGLFDHVVLQYLTSIPDVNTASALVSFILGAATNASIPPDTSSPLFQSLQSIPFLGVAVFGDVGPPELSSTVASFTTSSDSLFFGSSDGAYLRNWTIDTVGGPVVWTENATSPLVIRDSSLGNTPISQTWNEISIAISNNIPDIGLANITTTLQGTFSS